MKAVARKYVELVELEAEGEVVAVGPFPSAEAGSDFAEHIEHCHELPVNGSRGGVRILSVTELAAELGVTPKVLRAKK